MVEVPDIMRDLCRVLYFKVITHVLPSSCSCELLPGLCSQNLPRLNFVAAQAVSAFAVDAWLQNQLLHVS